MSLYSFFNDFNLKSEQQLKNQWPNGSKFTLRLFLVNFETFILVTIQCEHSMCETNANEDLVDQRLRWRPLEVFMRTNVVFRLIYIISNHLKNEKILTQASQGPLKVVQIHMPHPVDIYSLA